MGGGLWKLLEKKQILWKSLKNLLFQWFGKFLKSVKNCIFLVFWYFLKIGKKCSFLGSSVQTSSGVCWHSSTYSCVQVPEEGSGKFQCVCLCRFQRRVPGREQHRIRFEQGREAGGGRAVQDS